MLAPLIMTFGGQQHEKLAHAALIEGLFLLGILVLVTAFVYFEAPQSQPLAIIIPESH